MVVLIGDQVIAAMSLSQIRTIAITSWNSLPSVIEMSPAEHWEVAEKTVTTGLQTDTAPIARTTSTFTITAFMLATPAKDSVVACVASDNNFDFNQNIYVKSIKTVDFKTDTYIEGYYE